MHWIVQSNGFNERGVADLTQVLERGQIPHSFVKVIPFGGGIEPVIHPMGLTVVMGSTSLVKYAQTRGWTPGAWLNDNFDFRVWKQHYGAHLLNADATVTTFAEVQPRQKRFFIRPCHDSKAFAGMVTDWPDFEAWRQKVQGIESWRQIPDDLPVVVADLKPIQAEYRTVVVDGKVITASLYKQGTRVFYSDHVGPGVFDFAQDMANIWCPARAFVLDVFMCEGQLFVGEINCFNAAGFYELNVGKMVEAVENMEFKENT